MPSEQPQEPAFPQPWRVKGESSIVGALGLTIVGAPGMSMRDYFAAAAMQGLLASGNKWPLSDFSAITVDSYFSAIPVDSYKFADAMLAERQKQATGAE